MTRVLLALKYFISMSRAEQPYALGVFHGITIYGGTTRVLFALEYCLSISREEQSYALGVFYDITFLGGHD